MSVFYAQIRFRGSREWLTVAKAESKRSAFEYATAAFRQSRDDDGRAPIEVRVLAPRAGARGAGAPSSAWPGNPAVRRVHPPRRVRCRATVTGHRLTTQGLRGILPRTSTACR
jgi:hypothetical protein